MDKSEYMGEKNRNDHPLVSFIIACYNETIDQLSRSIDSALNQTYDNIQVVVVLDDPNNAELKDLITQYAQRNDNVVPVFNEVNLGPAFARNAAAAQADGEYLAIMDGDDISFPQRIEEELSVLLDDEYELVSASVIAIDEKGDKTVQTKCREADAEGLNKVLPHADPIQHSTVLMRASLFRKSGGYRNIKAVEDYDLWLRFLTVGAKMKIIDTPLVYYRVRSEGLTLSDKMLQHAGGKYAMKLYRERIKKGVDSYSEEHKREFFTKFGYYDLKKRKSFNENYLRLTKAITELRSGKSATCLFAMLKALIVDPKITHWFFDQVCGIAIWHIYSERIRE
jgi:glycosyltransferase involved in cell wall biosynthesis